MVHSGSLVKREHISFIFTLLLFSIPALLYLLMQFLTAIFKNQVFPKIFSFSGQKQKSFDFFLCCFVFSHLYCKNLTFVSLLMFYFVKRASCSWNVPFFFFAAISGKGNFLSICVNGLLLEQNLTLQLFICLHGRTDFFHLYLFQSVRSNVINSKIKQRMHSLKQTKQISVHHRSPWRSSVSCCPKFESVKRTKRLAHFLKWSKRCFIMTAIWRKDPLNYETILSSSTLSQKSHTPIVYWKLTPPLAPMRDRKW